MIVFLKNFHRFENKSHTSASLPKRQINQESRMGKSEAADHVYKYLTEAVDPLMYTEERPTYRHATVQCRRGLKQGRRV